MKVVNRTSRIPAYIFSRLDKVKLSIKDKGIDIIDLGIGDPDIPTPNFIIDSMAGYIRQPGNYNYSPYNGVDEFRKSVCKFYKRTYDVDLDYKTEVTTLIGSKEGIAHIFLALTDPGDEVLIPDPAYPVYAASAVIAGCNINKMPLVEVNNYLPAIDSIYPSIAKKAKILMVNYPNNPTGSTGNINFYEKLVEFGIKNDITIINDGAYNSLTNNKPISILQIPDAKKTCIEFGSLSKSYSMTGWRIGYVVGNKEAIEKLMIIKTNFDSGQFIPIQLAGATALDKGDTFVKYVNDIYNNRRNIVIKCLNKKGIDVYGSKDAFYVWFKVPSSYKSEEFSEHVLKATGVLVTPGNAFGDYGEGYCRISLTVETERITEAMNRIMSLNL